MIRIMAHRRCVVFVFLDSGRTADDKAKERSGD